MIEKFIAPLLAPSASGYQIDPCTRAPTLINTDWHDVGIEDAISGSATRDSNVFSDSQAGCGLHPKGHAKGQEKTYQTDFIHTRGPSDKGFPANCNNTENASQLYKVWRRGADESANTVRLNRSPPQNQLSMRFYLSCLIFHTDDDRMKE